MIGDAFVLDAVVHGYDLSPENQMNPAVCGPLAAQLYHGIHCGFSPRGEPEWVLPEEQFYRGTDTDRLAHALFAESQTDAAILHEVPNWGLFKDGPSPIWVGEELRERYPGRVAIYGAVSPWHKDPLEEIDRLVEEVGIVGLKLYPLDVIDGKPHSYRMDDPEVCFPILERAQQRGLRTVAVHKAVPLGPMPMEPFRVTDMEGAFTAFPDLFIEIVHGGFAFLEETAMQVARFPNAVINLEGTSAFINNAPMKFAEILGTFLSWGAADRIIWATGCIALHPRPLVERFWNFQFPEMMVDGFGVPPLTDEIKRMILAENAARIVGLDLETMKKEASGDEFAGRTELAPPWSGSKVGA